MAPTPPPDVPPPCKTACTKPPCACIDAIKYADWKTAAEKLAAKDKLFGGLDDDAAWTYTRVVNYAADKKARHGYGVRVTGVRADKTPILDGVYYFHISFQDGTAGDTEIAELAGVHSQWAATRIKETKHSFDTRMLAADDSPPKCGTPYTPSCPPDALLQGTARYLRDLRAGPGADPVELAKAAAGVDDLLLVVVKKALGARGVTTGVPTGLREAMAFLRSVTYRDAVDGGSPPGSATLERAGLEVEGLLLAALEDEVKLLPKA
jgi:hypothetical protein